jgi:hypothetical protein
MNQRGWLPKKTWGTTSLDETLCYLGWKNEKTAGQWKSPCFDKTLEWIM